MKRVSPLPLLLTCGLAGAQPPTFHWPLDESTGNVAHAWGGSDGQLAGGTTWDPTGGHHQGAARFDGVDDRIVLGPCDIITGSGAMTISLWTKPDFVTGMERSIIAKAVGPQSADHIWSIAFVNGTALRFRLNVGGSTAELTTSPSSLFGGNWYHIVGVYDGAEMRVYVNAGLLGSAPQSGIVGLHPQAPASIGALSTGSQPYSGWIDDVRIYDRALDLDEITDLLFANMTTGVFPDRITGNADLGMLSDRSTILTVYDPIGRVIWSGPGGTEVLGRLSADTEGIFIVRCQHQGATSTLKLRLLP